MISAPPPADLSGFRRFTTGRNKTFFFFSYEGFRNRKGATATSATVPTPEMYNGDFSNWVDAAGAVRFRFTIPRRRERTPSSRTGFVRDVSRVTSSPRDRFDAVSL